MTIMCHWSQTWAAAEYQKSVRHVANMDMMLLAHLDHVLAGAQGEGRPPHHKADGWQAVHSCAAL